MLALLVGCSPRPAPQPEALLLSPEPIPLASTLAAEGWRVERVPLPCDGSLPCWAKDPAQLGRWLDGFHARIRGRKVTVIGVSRGGYLALRMAGWPEVSQIVALSPVTDLSRLREFRGVTVPASEQLDPAQLGKVRAFVQIGNADTRVGTDAAMRYALAGMNPRLTVVVGESKGHHLPDTATAQAWMVSGSRIPQ